MHNACCLQNQSYFPSTQQWLWCNGGSLTVLFCPQISAFTAGGGNTFTAQINMHPRHTHLQTSHLREGGNCWFPASVNSKKLLSVSNVRRWGKKPVFVCIYIYVFMRILGAVSSNCPPTEAFCLCCFIQHWLIVWNQISSLLCNHSVFLIWFLITIYGPRCCAAQTRGLRRLRGLCWW